ncbi:hypothetical protein DIPPA_27968 [Diplonema papillatum]|nr:hypothetical protein DIPPA_27968 [Diplonema papillatum]
MSSVPQLLEAARIAYAGFGGDERRRAEAFIEDFKRGGGSEVAAAGFQVVQSGLCSGDQQLVHFGFHLLEDAIERQFTGAVAAAVADEWKAKVGLLLLSEPRGRLAQAKLAKLVGMLATRIWPEQWPSLLTDLAALWKRGDASGDSPGLELAMQCVLSLNEEAVLRAYVQKGPPESGVPVPRGRWDCGELTGSRKQTLLHSLEQSALPIAQLVEEFHRAHLDGYLRAGNDAPEPLNRQMALSVRILSHLVQRMTLSELVLAQTTSWSRLITHPEVCASIADLLYDIFETETFGSPSTSADGIDQQGGDPVKNRKQIVLDFLTPCLGFMTEVLRTDGRLQVGSDWDEVESAHRFAVRLADIIEVVGRNGTVLAAMCEDRRTLEMLKEMAIALLTHPAGLVQLRALSFVKRLLSTKKALDFLCEDPQLGFFHPFLVCINGRHLVKHHPLYPDARSPGAARVTEDAFKQEIASKKTRGTLSPDDLQRLYCVIDFAEEDEYLLHHMCVTSLHKEVASAVNQRYPIATLQYLAHVFREVLAFAASMPRAADACNAVGNVMHGTETYEAWSAAETCFMHFCSDTDFSKSPYLPAKQPANGAGGPDDNPNPLQVADRGFYAECMTRLCRSISEYLALDVKDGVVLAKYVGILQCAVLAIVPLLDDGQGRELLRAAVAKLVGKMVYMSEAERAKGEGVTSLDTVSARRKVHTCLLNVATHFGEKLTPELPDLLSASAGYQERDLLTDHEVSIFTESIVAVANALGPEKKEEVLCQILQPLMPRWHAMCASFGDKRWFASNFVQRPLAAGRKPGDDAADSVKGRLQKCLCVFLGVFKRSSSHFSGGGHGLNDAESVGQQSLVSLAAALLPGLIELTRTLRDVWKADFLTSFDPSLLPLLEVTPEEKEQSTGGSVTRSADLHATANLTPEQRKFVVRQSISQIRAASYALLASFAAFLRENYPAYQEALSTQLLFPTDGSTPAILTMELLQLKYFWNDFCLPFLLLTPEPAKDGLVRIMPQLCALFYQRLDAGWKHYTATYNKDTNVESAKFTSEGRVSTDDNWELKVLTDASNEVASTFFHVVNISKGTPVPKTKLKRITRNEKECIVVARACCAIVSDVNTVNAVLMLLTGPVVWPSAISAVRAVEALHKLLPSVVVHATLHETLCHLFGCCLQRLASLRGGKNDAATQKDSQLFNYLVNLTCDMFMHLAPVRREPAQMLLEMGGSQQAVAQLEAGLRTEKRESKRRSLFKNFLVPKRT